jgi:2-dehydropantoate 2-reductase
MTRIAVLGTGANGAGVGADLIRAGLDVTFIEQWPDHVEAMRSRGIEVRMPTETVVTEVHPLHLCEVATLRTPFDLVFVIMKAYDTRWAVELIKPHVRPDGLVGGVQNGMTVDTIADVMGPERTLGAVIEVSSAMWEAGIVERHMPPSSSWFALGGIEPSAHARADGVAEILRNAGTVQVTDDIRSAKWMKLVVNAAELVPAAIVDLPMRAAAALPGMREFMIKAGAEAMEAGVAAGRTPMPIFGLEGLEGSEPRAYVEPLIDAVFDQFALETTTTTVLQDWSKGRHSEVEEINGTVVREHQRVGATCPANQVTLDIGLEIERGESKPGLHQLDRMLAVL